MKRYALPLGILGVTLILIALIALGTKGAPDYSKGRATPQPMSAEWVQGNASSSVVVIQYSDFQCPACAAYESLLRRVVAAYGDKVAFVYRHFPLIQIHANADLAARAAEAAGLQGKFWDMHAMLFNNHDAWEKLVNAKEAFTVYAERIGLNLEQFKKDIDSPAVAQEVADDYARGQASRVTGTPSFFVNGTQIAPRGYDEFAAALDAALGKK